MCKYCNPIDDYRKDEDERMLYGDTFQILDDDYETVAYWDGKGHELTFEFGNHTLLRHKINYCPMCGRKLSGSDCE